MGFTVIWLAGWLLCTVMAALNFNESGIVQVILVSVTLVASFFIWPLLLAATLISFMVRSIKES